MITIQASKEVGYHCGCGCYHWKDNVNQWCHQTKMATCIESEGKICRNSKLWKTVWVIDVPARGSSTQTHLGEAGRSWLKGVHCQPADMIDLVVRGEEGLLERAWMGLPSSSANAQSMLLTRSITLWGKDIFGSDFRLSSLKLVGSICQAAWLSCVPSDSSKFLQALKAVRLVQQFFWQMQYSIHGSYFSKDKTLDLSHFLCSF